MQAVVYRDGQPEPYETIGPDGVIAVGMIVGVKRPRLSPDGCEPAGYLTVAAEVTGPGRVMSPEQYGWIAARPWDQYTSHYYRIADVVPWIETES